MKVIRLCTLKEHSRLCRRNMLQQIISFTLIFKHVEIYHVGYYNIVISEIDILILLVPQKALKSLEIIYIIVFGNAWNSILVNEFLSCIV